MSIYLNHVEKRIEQWGYWAERDKTGTETKATCLANHKPDISNLKTIIIDIEDVEALAIDAIISELNVVDPVLNQIAWWRYVKRLSVPEVADKVRKGQTFIRNSLSSITTYVAGAIPEELDKKYREIIFS